MGEVVAHATVDIDERRTGYSGAITLTYGPPYPVFLLHFVANQPGESTHISAPVFAFDYGTANQLSPDELRQRLPAESWTFATRAEIDIKRVETGLKFTWTTDNDPKVRSQIIPLSPASLPSTLKPEIDVSSWEDFKAFLSAIPQDRYIFRGQSHNAWRLRTSFHRAGRADLHRYLLSDVRAAMNALAPQLKRTFATSNPDEHAAFLHLLQHHGYPTPLLDWSRSPFVAAYFAFATRRANQSAPVRIHIFDTQAWELHHPRSNFITHVGPTVSILAAMPIGNPRSRPQQSLSTATNVDDLEGYIERRENEVGTNFLMTVDLPYSERARALRDLRTMNITAESLFPGLEGTLQALAIENFDLDVQPLQ